MLEREQRFYESYRDEYLRYYEGQYVLIRGDEFYGAYSTEQLAYEMAVSKFGNAAVLIRKVAKDGEPCVYLPHAAGFQIDQEQIMLAAFFMAIEALRSAARPIPALAAEVAALDAVERALDEWRRTLCS